MATGTIVTSKPDSRARTGILSRVTSDLVSSFVVFLVALPLCMGVAIASGAPPALGIIKGMIGGVLVVSISGSPLQVSGPADRLSVIVFEFVHQFGLEALSPILLLAGLL